MSDSSTIRISVEYKKHKAHHPRSRHLPNHRRWRPSPPKPAHLATNSPPFISRISARFTAIVNTFTVAVAVDIPDGLSGFEEQGYADEAGVSERRPSGPLPTTKHRTRTKNRDR
jgi:hypothetical protein